MIQFDEAKVLRERIADLEEEVCFLRGEVFRYAQQKNVDRIRAAFGLTPSQAMILAVLHANPDKPVEAWRLLESLPPRDHVQDRQVKGIHVRMVRIRKRVGTGAVESVWGRGYRLTEEGRKLISAVIDGERRAA